MKPQDLLEKLRMTAMDTEASTPVLKVHVHPHQYSRYDYVSTDGVWVYPGDIFDLVRYVEELEANLDYHRSFTQLSDPPPAAMACTPDLQVTQLQGIGGPARNDDAHVSDLKPVKASSIDF